MLGWVGNDQPMKMRETSRAIDKKLWDNNKLELHAHQDNQMYKLLQDGQNKMSDCLISAITTAGFNTNSFCYDHYEYCKSILSGIVSNDKIFIFIAELDKDDDIWDEENWYKCTPCLQYDDVLLDNLRTQAISAREKGGTELRNFKVKCLNIWVNGKGENQYLDHKELLACGCDKTLEFLRGRKVIMGLDLSSGGDLCSLALEFKYKNEEGKIKYFIHQHSFIPKKRLEEHIESDKVPYDEWIKEGLLTATEGIEGIKTDYKYIIKYIKDLIKEYQIEIECIAYDGHNASTFLSDLEDITTNLIEIKQSAQSLNDATEDFRLEVKAGNIEYNKEDKLLIWSFGNAITTNNSFKEIKLDKINQKHRIDVCDAVIDAHKIVFRNEEYVDMKSHVKNYLDRMGF